jgi:anaerobic C4-dicarboxylate transporter
MGSDSFLNFLGLVLCIGVLGALPIALYFQQERRKREMKHTERMKALELGRTISVETEDSSWSTLSKIAGTIGAGVPIGVFGFAWLASEKVGHHEVIWIGATMVGTAAVICGSCLVYSLNARPTTDPLIGSKPPIEEDAFDVVSGRG